MARPSSIVAGEQINYWTVIGHAGFRNRRAIYLCRCACGTERQVSGSNLRNGNSLSCGCVGLNRKRLGPFQSLYNRFLRDAGATREVRLSFEEFLRFTEITACHYCGCEVSWAKHNISGPGSSARYNLDRKDNLVGYLNDNLVVCCKRCNWAKGDRFTYREWLQIGSLIRSWAEHDRDVNAAQNALISGLGWSHETVHAQA